MKKINLLPFITCSLSVKKAISPKLGFAAACLCLMLNITHVASAQVSLTTVSTIAASNVTANSATLNGNIADDGGGAIAQRGFEFFDPSSTFGRNEIASGTETGVFSKEITGLTAGTAYRYRAYARNILGTSYGDLLSFSTIAAMGPAISTIAASNVTANSTTLNGNIISDGGGTISEISFIYSTIHNNRTGLSMVTDGTVTGAFSKRITGLTANTQYQYRAFMKIGATSSKTYSGDLQYFTTLPIVSTELASNVTSNAATLNGNIADGGDGTITERGFEFHFSDTDIRIEVASGTETGAFSKEITGLTVGTAYTYRAYVTNSSGTGYSEVESFTTATTVLSNEDFKKTGVSVSPNPTTGILNIAAHEKINYKLLNIKGQVIKKGVLATGEGKIDVSPFAKGIYLLNIETSKGRFTKKIVKD